jgi:hypothetical protein
MRSRRRRLLLRTADGNRRRNVVRSLHILGAAFIVTRKRRPDWDITAPELKSIVAARQGRKEFFYPCCKRTPKDLRGVLGASDLSQPMLLSYFESLIQRAALLCEPGARKQEKRRESGFRPCGSRNAREGLQRSESIDRSIPN